MFRSLIYERYVGVYAESDEITVTLNGEKAVIIRIHSEFADSNIIKKHSRQMNLSVYSIR